MVSSRNGMSLFRNNPPSKGGRYGCVMTAALPEGA
jgi:hypothetical protein